jgi:hypothetical protein
VTDQEDDRAVTYCLRDSLELRIVDIDLRIVMAPYRGAIECVHHLDRERCLCRGHLAQVACRLREHILHRAVTLLRDIRNMVTEARVGKHIALQRTRYLVTSATNDALRALQRNQRLVSDKLTEFVFRDTGHRAPLAQLAEVSTITGNVCQPFGPVLRKPAPPAAAGLGDTAVEEVPQGSAASRDRRG